MMVTEEVVYSESNTSFRGYLAYDDEVKGLKPCVMIAHDWSGRREAFCEKAKQWAGMGYVGFALDLYGDAQLGHDNEQRLALMTPLAENREHLAKRMLAAFRAACEHPQIDEHKIVVTGYCFGGLCALDLARTGANLRGVISFHGLLSEPKHKTAAEIKAKVLVLHGYDDPLVLPEQVTQFAREMTLKNVDWQVHMYGLTKHSFTNPDAHDEQLGLYYNQTADKRSWTSSVAFLSEVFA